MAGGALPLVSAANTRKTATKCRTSPGVSLLAARWVFSVFNQPAKRFLLGFPVCTGEE